MQQHSGLQKRNLEVDATPEQTHAFTREALEIQQLRAELWLERCLNQLQHRINDCLVCAFKTQKTAASVAEIFQTVVKELSVALGTDSVVIALATTAASDLPSESELACQICYVAPKQQARTDLTKEPTVILARGKTLCLELGEAIALEDLQQLQNQKPQSAWSIHDDQGVLGWLIAATSPPQSDTELLEKLKAQLLPQLVEQSLTAAKLALAQNRRLEATFLQCQQLEARNQELARTNRLKSEFLANTSHEIRTPLSSILGFTHLLLAQGYNPDNQRHREYLNIILSSGQHLLALINDILDLSKIEANQLEVHKEPVDVPELCRSAMALVKEKANDKGLQLRLDLDAHASTVLADSLRLKQMLFNLLSNALKFTTSGEVGLQVKHKGVFLHFTVWDTGTGISKEEQTQLFQPYSQIANVVAGRTEGTGLGLALTQKLAELHGGWVEIQSELNRGSQFTVVLPSTRAAEGEGDGKIGRWGDREIGRELPPCPLIPRGGPEFPPAPFAPNPLKGAPSSPKGTPSSPLPPYPQRGPRVPPITESPTATAPIMLVEDNIHNAKLMTTYLRKLGYQITWVKNAAQMWQALEGSQPALILMDINLPDVDGLTLVQQLQAQEQYRTIPVIAQTAMAMKGDRETCLAAGAIEYISKPIDLKVLAALVSKYSDRDR